MRENTKKSPISEALRAQGFVPLPRLWVQSRDIPKIHAIAGQYSDQVNAVRGEVHAREEVLGAVPDPKNDREAAWAAYEQARNNV